MAGGPWERHTRRERAFSIFAMQTASDYLPRLARAARRVQAPPGAPFGSIPLTFGSFFFYAHRGVRCFTPIIQNLRHQIVGTAGETVKGCGSATGGTRTAVPALGCSGYSPDGIVDRRWVARQLGSRRLASACSCWWSVCSFGVVCTLYPPTSMNAYVLHYTVHATSLLETARMHSYLYGGAGYRNTQWAEARPLL